MRSRVNKNQTLYSQIASDTESKVESHDLSHFANRLNAIDEQFGKMDIESQKSEPNHARSLQERYKEEQVEAAQSVTPPVELPKVENEIQQEDHSESIEYRTHDEFDTFESTYLNDFLQEVKEYNVKKGYRNIDNTSTNIMKDLNLDIEINKSRFIADTDNQSPFIPDGIDDLLTQIDPLLSEDDEVELTPVQQRRYEEVVFEDEVDHTRLFTAVDHMQRFDQDDAHLEETIAMEVQRMVGLDEPISYDKTLEVEVFDEDIDEPLFEQFVEVEPVVEPIIEESLDDVEKDEAVVEEVVVEEFLTPFGYQSRQDAPVGAPSIKVQKDDFLDVIDGAIQKSEASYECVDEVVESQVEGESEEIQPVSEEDNDEVTKRLLEQTHTLQIKVIDQEKNIEEISDTMVRTNRLLNVTLSLLMLAIFVVIMLIVSNFWR